MTRDDAARLAADTLAGHVARCRRCRDGCGCDRCKGKLNPLCPLGRRLSDAAAGAANAAARTAT